jgi:hypothetical protein
LEELEWSDYPPMISVNADNAKGEVSGAPQIVIQDVYGKYFWGSKDLGATWVQPCEKAPSEDACFKNPGTQVPGQAGLVLTAVQAHPTRPDWLMALVETCSTFYYDDDCAIVRLLVSGDFGQTWHDGVTNSKGGVVSFAGYSWAPDDGKAEIPPIYATVYRTSDGFYNRASKGWNYNIDLVLSTDLFKTHTLVEECANAFGVSFNDIYTATPTDCKEYRKEPSSHSGVVTDVTLRMSFDKGKTFTDACFPIDLQKSTR